MGKSLGEMFLQGGWVMWPLLILSVITWAIVLERALVLLLIRPRVLRITESLMRSLQAGDPVAAKQICLSEKKELGEIFLSTVDTGRTREAAERVTERNKAKMAVHLKRNLWVLGTIGSASPFIGLLGTVVGIIRAFHEMANKGTGGFSVVSAGISEALIATAAGLVVAIIALFAYNIFTTAANQMMISFRITLDELIDASFTDGKKSRA
jgi:biopolymer transport protein ExbB